MIYLIATFIVACLILWGLGQLPIDAVMMRIGRVIVVIVWVLLAMSALGMFHGHFAVPRW